MVSHYGDCLLYTSDAADDLLCVDLGGRRIIKKKIKKVLRNFHPHCHDPININNESVQLVENARYLGIHLDSKLNWETHFRNRESNSN